MTASPSVVNRLGNVVFMRSIAGGGIGAAVFAAFHRRTAFDATLLTFCPPGPPERAKLHSSSSSGMAMVSVIGTMGAFQSRQLAPRVASFAKRTTSSELRLRGTILGVKKGDSLARIASLAERVTYFIDPA